MTKIDYCPGTDTRRIIGRDDKLGPDSPKDQYNQNIRAHMRFSNRVKRVGFQTVFSITQEMFLPQKIKFISFISTRRGGSFEVHASSWWSHNSPISWNWKNLVSYSKNIQKIQKSHKINKIRKINKSKISIRLNLIKSNINLIKFNTF